VNTVPLSHSTLLHMIAESPEVSSAMEAYIRQQVDDPAVSIWSPIEGKMVKEGNPDHPDATVINLDSIHEYRALNVIMRECEDYQQRLQREMHIMELQDSPVSTHSGAERDSHDEGGNVLLADAVGGDGSGRPDAGVRRAELVT